MMAMIEAFSDLLFAPESLKSTEIIIKTIFVSS